MYIDLVYLSAIEYVVEQQFVSANVLEVVEPCCYEPWAYHAEYILDEVNCVFTVYLI